MRGRRLLAIALGVGVAVATFVFVLPRIADYGDVWAVVRELSWRQLCVLGLVTLLNLATYAPPWQAALPGLGFRPALVVTLASTASTYLAPGGAAVGMALSYGMLRGWGFSPRRVGLAVAVTGIWNQFAMLGFPILALALLSLSQEHNRLLSSVALIGVVIFAGAAAAFVLGLSTPRLARRVGDYAARLATWGRRSLRRSPVAWTGETFVRFRDETIGLLRRRWHVLTVATLAGHLTVFLLLLVSLRVLDVPSSDVSAAEAFAAWSIARLLGSLPITPGGIGIVEVGLTASLVGFGGRNAAVVAVVLVYRFLSTVPTLVLGLLAAATWRRHRPANEPSAA